MNQVCRPGRGRRPGRGGRRGEHGQHRGDGQHRGQHAALPKRGPRWSAARGRIVPEPDAAPDGQPGHHRHQRCLHDDHDAVRRAEQVVQRDQHQHGDHPGDHDHRDQPERGVGVQPDQAAHGRRIAPPGHRGTQCVHEHPGPHHGGQHMADGEQRAADRHDALRMGPDGLGHDHAEQRQHAQPGLAQPERGRRQQERHALDRDQLALAGADQRRHRRVPGPGQHRPGGEHHPGQGAGGDRAEQRGTQRPRRGQRRRGGALVLPRQAPAGQPAQRAGQPGQHAPAQHGDQGGDDDCHAPHLGTAPGRPGDGPAWYWR